MIRMMNYLIGSRAVIHLSFSVIFLLLATTTIFLLVSLVIHLAKNLLQQSLGSSMILQLTVASYFSILPLRPLYFVRSLMLPLLLKSPAIPWLLLMK
jgi:hypothetical protein